MHSYTRKCHRRFILLVGLILFFGSFRYLSATPAFASQAQSRATDSSAKAKTIQIGIAGMTCAACARGLEASFRRMAGVQKVNVDYKTGQAVISFNPAKQSAAGLSAHVLASGFQVKAIKVL